MDVASIVVIVGGVIGLGYVGKKLLKEINDRDIDVQRTNSSRNIYVEDIPTVDGRYVDIPQASSSPYLYGRESIDEPTATEIPHGISYRGGKTKRKRRLQKRSTRNKTKKRT